MNTKIFYIILTTISLLGLNSCKERIMDVPPYNIPSADTSGGTVITIEEFKNLASLQNNEVYPITDSIFVRGVVTANDISGNIYKEIYIKDATGSLKISLNAKSLYLKYPVGQTVYLNCKGFYLGHYFEVPIFGGPLASNARPGRIEEVDIPRAILLDGLPSLTKPELEPEVLVGATGLTLPNDLSKLVKLTNVSFEAAGSQYGKPEAYPERTVVDQNGNKMVLSMSAFATFALDTIPSGSFDITGVVGSYQDVPQLKIRDINDVQPTSSSK